MNSEPQNNALAVALKQAMEKYKLESVSKVNMQDFKDIVSEVNHWMKEDAAIS